jgi:hypothetical protein
MPDSAEPERGTRYMMITPGVKNEAAIFKSTNFLNSPQGQVEKSFFSLTIYPCSPR